MRYGERAFVPSLGHLPVTVSNSYLVGFYRHFLSVFNASSIYVETAGPACMVLLNLFCIFSVDQISF